MSDERLNSLAIFSIEKGLSSALDLNNVIDRYANQSNRRILL